MKQKMLKEMHDSFINETLYFDRLDNGLPVYIMTKKGFQQKYAVFTTNYGSLDNKFHVPGKRKILTVPDGMAHFLEHKMFEDNDVNIFEQFARYGANVNAYTTYTLTSYLFDTIEYFPECLELLLNFVQTLYITDETIEKEKGIIAQEIRMYEDDPDWATYLNLLEIMFHNHPVKIDIAGTIESIAKINQELLLQCYNTFYHPGNMVLFIIGDVDPLQVLEIVKENQANKKYSFRAPMNRFFSSEPKHVCTSRVENQFAVSRPIYHLGFKDQTLGEDGDLLHKKDLVMSMLLEVLIGKGSELYQELYELGLIDDSFSVSVTLEKDHGMTVLGGHTNNPEKLHTMLLKGIDKKKNKIKSEEIERVRKRMIGDYIVSFDSLKSTAQTFVSYYFKNFNIFRELKLLKEISLTDLNQKLCEHFDYVNHAVSIMYPEKK